MAKLNQSVTTRTRVLSPLYRLISGEPVRSAGRAILNCWPRRNTNYDGDAGSVLPALGSEPGMAFGPPCPAACFHGTSGLYPTILWVEAK